MSRRPPPRKRPRRARIGAAAGAAVLLAAVGVAVQLGGGGPQIADASDAELVALGAAVYREHCASCHGAYLEGEPGWRRRKPDGALRAPPHDASGHTWHHSDEQLFRLTRDGPAAVAGGGYRSDMPGFGDTLDDREIWAVLAYIKSRWPARIREIQARRNAAAAQ